MWPIHRVVLHRQVDQTHSSVFSFSVTTPTVDYSDDSEWIWDTGATYHVCSNKDWFSSFEKVNSCFVVMSDNHPCKMKGICTVIIKMFDEMVWELKKARYVPQLKKKFISVGALEALDLEKSGRDGFLRYLETRWLC